MDWRIQGWRRADLAFAARLEDHAEPAVLGPTGGGSEDPAGKEEVGGNGVPRSPAAYFGVLGFAAFGGAPFPDIATKVKNPVIRWRELPDWAGLFEGIHVRDGMIVALLEARLLVLPARRTGECVRMHRC